MAQRVSLVCSPERYIVRIFVRLPRNAGSIVENYFVSVLYIKVCDMSESRRQRWRLESGGEGCRLENDFAWSTAITFLGAREIGALSSVCRGGRRTIEEFNNWKLLTLRRFPRVGAILAVRKSSFFRRDWRAIYENQLGVEKSHTPAADEAVATALGACLDATVATLEISIVLEHESFTESKEVLVVSCSMVPKFLEPEVIFEGLWTRDTFPPLLAWYLRRNHCTSDAEYETDYGWIGFPPNRNEPPENCEQLPCPPSIAAECEARLRLRMYFTREHMVEVYDGEVDDYGSKRLFFDLKAPISSNPFYAGFAELAVHVDVEQVGLAGVTLMMRNGDFAFDALTQLWFFNDVVSRQVPFYRAIDSPALSPPSPASNKRFL